MLFNFNQKQNDLTNFSKTFWHQMLWKSVWWFSHCYVWGGMQTWNLLSHFCSFLLQMYQNVIKCNQQPKCGRCVSIIHVMLFFLLQIY